MKYLTVSLAGTFSHTIRVPLPDGRYLALDFNSDGYLTGIEADDSVLAVWSDSDDN